MSVNVPGVPVRLKVAAPAMILYFIMPAWGAFGIIALNKMICSGSIERTPVPSCFWSPLGWVLWFEAV